MIPITNGKGRKYNIDIEFLDERCSWIEDNGRMLIHLVDDEGGHIQGYYFMGIDDRGIHFIPFGTNILDNDLQGILVMDGVDIV